MTPPEHCTDSTHRRALQPHHGAREVFLTATTDHQWTDTILRKAYVYPPADFGTALDGEEGNDVFLCEYEYDEAWRRFRRAKQQVGGWEMIPWSAGSWQCDLAARACASMAACSDVLAWQPVVVC